ncbi:hypothetical protein B0H12DRAFT_88668 [Mycena haematopus]|nr:hypothetical protein B0H12DRAFT_88668 [Mycena haematopus]
MEMESSTGCHITVARRRSRSRNSIDGGRFFSRIAHDVLFPSTFVGTFLSFLDSSERHFAIERAAPCIPLHASYSSTERFRSARDRCCRRRIRLKLAPFFLILVLVVVVSAYSQPRPSPSRAPTRPSPPAPRLQPVQLAFERRHAVAVVPSTSFMTLSAPRRQRCPCRKYASLRSRDVFLAFAHPTPMVIQRLAP